MLNFVKNTSLVSIKALVPALACAALASACSHGEKAQPAPPSPAAQAQAQLGAEQTNYVSQTQTRLDQLTKFSQDLRIQAATAGSDPAKAKKMSNAADDLEALLIDVRKELADVQTAAPTNWVDEKRDVQKTMSRAETQYSNSVSLMQ